MLGTRDLDGKEALKPGEGRVDRAHGECQMVDAEAYAVPGGHRIGGNVGGWRTAKPRHLPELHEDAGRRTRRDEGRLVAVAVVAAVDDAEPRVLEERHVIVEPPLLHVERQVVEPLATPCDESVDEAPRSGALDQLDLPVADEEVGPRELPIVSGPRGLPHADRQ